MGTNDKKGFIQLNGLSSDYKVPENFLKAVLLSMYSSAYLPHFENARSEVMKRFATSKVN